MATQTERRTVTAESLDTQFREFADKLYETRKLLASIKDDVLSFASHAEFDACRSADANGWFYDDDRGLNLARMTVERDKGLLYRLLQNADDALMQGGSQIDSIRSQVQWTLVADVKTMAEYVEAVNVEVNAPAETLADEAVS